MKSAYTSYFFIDPESWPISQANDIIETLNNNKKTIFIGIGVVVLATTCFYIVGPAVIVVGAFKFLAPGSLTSFFTAKKIGEYLFGKNEVFNNKADIDQDISSGGSLVEEIVQQNVNAGIDKIGELASQAFGGNESSMQSLLTSTVINTVTNKVKVAAEGAIGQLGDGREIKDRSKNKNSPKKSITKLGVEMVASQLGDSDGGESNMIEAATNVYSKAKYTANTVNGAIGLVQKHPGKALFLSAAFAGVVIGGAYYGGYLDAPINAFVKKLDELEENRINGFKSQILDLKGRITELDKTPQLDVIENKEVDDKLEDIPNLEIDILPLLQYKDRQLLSKMLEAEDKTVSDNKMSSLIEKLKIADDKLIKNYSLKLLELDIKLNGVNRDPFLNS